MTDRRNTHRAALTTATEWAHRVSPADLARATPCAEWDLAALLAHMVGQHEGFALAVRDGNAPASAYAPVSFSTERWDLSATMLLDAFAGADLDAQVIEVELAPTPLPMTFVVAAQFLDTVVHTWDVARALGEWYEPSADVVADVAAITARIPDGANRESPGAAFAHATATSGDPWRDVLAQLGRTTA